MAKKGALTGLLLFGIFFGAGNLIFPPSLGCLLYTSFDWADLKGKVRDTLTKYLFDQTKRRPAVLPVVMEAK